MNYDEFEPVAPADSGGYYSTGRPSKKRHTGLLVALSMAAVVGCAGAALASLFDLRLEHAPGRTSLTLVERNPEVSATRLAATNVGALTGDAKAQSDSAMLQLSKPPLREDGELSLTELYQKVIPSVVTVITSTASDAGAGCGVILSADGYLITDYQMAQSDGAITVMLNDSTEYIASVVGSDDASDLAVLKIDATDLPTAEFGNADLLTVGDAVACIGNPMGLELRGTMTNGIISAINRDLNLEERTMGILQTNAIPSTGAFGGPLINLYGQVIGINVRAIGGYSGETVDGLRFAIPINDAKAIVEELIANGSIPGRPAIGISGQAVPAAAQAYYRLPEGVYVDSIVPGSAADQVGLLPGDIITAINGMAVATMDELNLYKNRYSSGDIVILHIFRNNSEFDLSLTLGERK